MTIEQVEDFFCRNFRKKEKDNMSKKRPNHFYSKVTWLFDAYVPRLLF